ncbi:18192_t:CDS:2 [Entrophospora sp. SA101]|nr:3320_t:CDS:2 [Entrophospora sp. SA101]CAJ0638112.1 12745_t:CDS:2 [Entrophospora sp. SA101]CAJ0767515.1 18192_t:CDS:2 [Entrophospora sp. SA101]CAJ0832847.1 13939_t:CDS:2 [Entrophospora sp. SA101]CAJ0891989.1 6672_t:CDS:2 [Entrophospora sp. SA101]
MLIHFQQNFHKLQLLNLFPYRSFSSTIKIFVIRRPGSGSRRGGRSGFENDIKDLKLYEFDSITKDGFELLLAQSEVRKYLRKAKHEIPKLTEFAEAFKPPTSKEILCFKRQYYIGEDNHLQNKAVMTVDVNKLELSSAEKHKFLLICGPRYDGENTIKFSYDKFPNYAQNKNYLGDLLNKILEEVKVTSTGYLFMYIM